MPSRSAMACARKPLHDEVHDLDLTRRQPLNLARSSLERLLARKLIEGARQASVDGRQQLRVVHRLLDEILRPGLDGGDSHGHVGMAGDQHDRQR